MGWGRVTISPKTWYSSFPCTFPWPTIPLDNRFGGKGHCLLWILRECAIPSFPGAYTCQCWDAFAPPRGVNGVHVGLYRVYVSVI